MPDIHTHDMSDPEKSQVEGDASPIVAPTPETAGGAPSVDADHQHHRQEQPAEGPDSDEAPAMPDPDIAPSDPAEGPDDRTVLDDAADAGDLI